MAKSYSKKRPRSDAGDVQDRPGTKLQRSATFADNSEPSSKRPRVESNKSLFVRSLGPNVTSESLAEWFSQHYPVKHAVVVVDREQQTSRGYGFVTFTEPEDAAEAKRKLNNELLDGRRVKLENAEPRWRREDGDETPNLLKLQQEKREREKARREAFKPPRLIVRNLPWSIKTKEQLSALFAPYGLVRFADLPQSVGRLRGFGFVTMRGKAKAEKAMVEVNGREIDGRTIAVDWAVDKDTWEKEAETEGEDKESAEEKKSNMLEDQGKKNGDMNELDADVANFFNNHFENLEDEDEETEEDEDYEDDKDADEEDENYQDEDDGAEPKSGRQTDNSTTLFVRNLPYTATDEQLKAHFACFGPVRYARVVMNKTTDRPAGTGFVCFFNLADSQSCLKGAPARQVAPSLDKTSILQDETADPSGNYTIEGRILQVAQAVDKEKAILFTSQSASARKKGIDKDRRRLYLLSEGAISRSSPMFKLLTPAEVRLRETSAKQRKKQIEGNPSLHLSLTRLAMRNIPRNITSKDLKALARQAVVGFAEDVKAGRRQPLSKEELARAHEHDKEAERRRKEKGRGVVRQAKVVFETKEGTKVADEKVAEGGAKSRGYGFIEYSSHRWALMGLRWLNGHALKSEAGKTQRLIAEFAIENVNVVQRRRMLEEKGRQQESGKAQKKESEEGEKTAGKKRTGKKMKVDAVDKEDKPIEEAEGKARQSAVEKLAARTKIIARKRMLRKRRAQGKAN